MAANIKIAIPGKSITSTDPRDFSLNLSYAIWKILSENRLILTNSRNISSTKWVTCYEKDGSGNWRMATTDGDSNGDFHGVNFGGLLDGWDYSAGASYYITYFETVDGLQS